jgi:hypothetical protein
MTDPNGEYFIINLQSAVIPDGPYVVGMLK